MSKTFIGGAVCREFESEGVGGTRNVRRCRMQLRTVQFLARDSEYAIARSLPTPVRLSVCLSVRPSVPLSVTRVDQSKTVHDRITQSSPQSSPMTLVS